MSKKKEISWKDQRELAEWLTPLHRKMVHSTILKLYEMRKNNEEFFKPDGVIYISSVDIIVEMYGEAMAAQPSFLLSVQRYLKWKIIERGSGFNPPFKMTSRPVSRYYEENFHDAKQIPSEDAKHYWNMFHGQDEGNGHGILILPERHPFALYCLKQKPKTACNRNSGIVAELREQHEAGNLTDDEYENNLASLIPMPQLKIAKG